MSGSTALCGRQTRMFAAALILCALLSAYAGGNADVRDGRGAPGPSIHMEGVFIERSFVNKAGREYPSVRELYFRTGGEEYFVRLDRSRVKTDLLRALAGKPVRVRAVKAFGLWDTDDPNAQSRVGEYLIIEEIVEQVR